MTPSTTASVVPASKTARNITNLANHPASGGMPASENKKTDIISAKPGSVRPRPAKLEISADRRAPRAAMTAANAPRFIAP